MASDIIEVNPATFANSPIRKRSIYMMNMGKIVQHLWSFIKLEQTENVIPILILLKK